MANLDQNTIWNQVSNAPAKASEAVMGPSYSYTDNIKGPAQMGVGNRGTMGQLATNTGAISDYVKYMVSGPALGNQYFVNTGGSCMAPDKSIQARYNYINNIASGDAILPASMRQGLGGIASNFNGLIPGIIEDTEQLNPLYLFSSLAADSTPSCECYTCPTSGGDQSRFLNTDLTPDFSTSKCVKADPSKCIQTTEGFDDGTGYAVGSIAVGALAIGLMFYISSK
jgi:hypothetical protein